MMCFAHELLMSFWKIVNKSLLHVCIKYINYRAIENLLNLSNHVLITQKYVKQNDAAPSKRIHHQDTLSAFLKIINDRKETNNFSLSLNNFLVSSSSKMQKIG